MGMDRWTDGWQRKEGGWEDHLSSTLLFPFKSKCSSSWCLPGSPAQLSWVIFLPHTHLAWHVTPTVSSCWSPLFWEQPPLCRVSLWAERANKGWFGLPSHLINLSHSSPFTNSLCITLNITLIFVLQIKKWGPERLPDGIQMMTGRARVWIYDVCLQSPCSVAFVSSASGVWCLTRPPNGRNVNTSPLPYYLSLWTLFIVSAILHKYDKYELISSSLRTTSWCILSYFFSRIGLNWVLKLSFFFCKQTHQLKVQLLSSHPCRL